MLRNISKKNSTSCLKLIGKQQIILFLCHTTKCPTEAEKMEYAKNAVKCSLTELTTRSASFTWAVSSLLYVRMCQDSSCSCAPVATAPTFTLSQQDLTRAFSPAIRYLTFLAALQSHSRSSGSTTGSLVGNLVLSAPLSSIASFPPLPFLSGSSTGNVAVPSFISTDCMLGNFCVIHPSYCRGAIFNLLDPLGPPNSPVCKCQFLRSIVFGVGHSSSPR